MHHERAVDERDKRLMLRAADIPSEEGLDALSSRTLLRGRPDEAHSRRTLFIEL
ncbi:hypothetical protein [Methylobacterium terricola]|uniref:hypothetical protein n=1 Tax=Methylobacterium terricola TaxID=2583531 RepID=UPI0014861356|nr:hypothetical protein [Methylobacterium terricola]